MMMIIPRWFARGQTVTHPSTNPAAHGRGVKLEPVDKKSDDLTNYQVERCESQIR